MLPTHCSAPNGAPHRCRLGRVLIQFIRYMVRYIQKMHELSIHGTGLLGSGTPSVTLPPAFCLYLFAASGVLLSTISFACRRFLSSPAGIRGRCWIWAGSLAVSFITVSITILRFARLCLVCCCRVFRKVLPFSHTQFHSGRLWLCSGRFFIRIIRLSSRCILSPVASCDS